MILIVEIISKGRKDNYRRNKIITTFDHIKNYICSVRLDLPFVLHTCEQPLRCYSCTKCNKEKNGKKRTDQVINKNQQYRVRDRIEDRASDRERKSEKKNDRTNEKYDQIYISFCACAL